MMIYLGTKKIDDDTLRHEFYYNHRFYHTTVKIGYGIRCSRLTLYGEEVICEIPSVLHIISYNGEDERMCVLRGIVEQKIFENI